MKAKVIGIGAAGSKAAINLIEKGIMERKDVILINSTIGDVPIEYRDIAIKYSNSTGGAGKERKAAKQLCIASINDGTLSCLDSLMDPDDKMVIIVNSSEGGTGCGSAPVIAKYMNDVIGTKVHTFVFTGFEEDGRGLQNTMEYFQELSEDFIVEAISNSKFLVGNNKIAAERRANDEFVERVKVLLGIGIVDSEQNIDETDLYKVSTTPGFMNIEHIILNDRIKNIDMFNKLIIDAIDYSKSLESPDLSAKRIAVFMNLSDKSREFVDYSFSIIKERYGTPYEIFTHIQYDGKEEYINFIVSGMNLPLGEIERVYEKYQSMSNSVNISKDKFLEKTRAMSGPETNSMFDMISNSKTTKKESEYIEKKKSFLNDFESQWESQLNGFMNTVVVNNNLHDDEQKRKKKEFLNNEF